jgi:hypothetical protein
MTVKWHGSFPLVAARNDKVNAQQAELRCQFC